MTDNPFDTIIKLSFAVIAVSLCARLYLNRPRIKHEAFTQDGVPYMFMLGNHIVDLSGTPFNGITITLPKALPNIYIDSHSDKRAPRFSLPKACKLSLEGDFDHFFQVYTLPENRILSLSILSPDVMQVLVDILPDYDVEIVGRELRLVTDHKVYNQVSREIDLLDKSKELVSEIAHRLKSWEAIDSDETWHIMPKGFSRVYKIGSRSLPGFWFRSGLVIAYIALILLPSSVAADIKDGNWNQVVAHSIGSILLFPFSWILICLLHSYLMRKELKASVLRNRF